MRPRLVRLLVLLLPACAPGEASSTGFASSPATSVDPGPSSFGTRSEPSTADTPTTAEPTTTEPLTTSTTTTTSELTTTTTTTEPTTTTTTGDTDLPPTCGDGLLDDGEQCDDGNLLDGDACLADCTPGALILALLGVGTEPAIAATFTPGLGWTHQPAPIGLAEAALAATPDGAMAVVRRASPLPDQQNELWYARWTSQDPALFDTYNQVGEFGVASDGPALAALADTLTLTFLGTDHKHYTALFTDAWGPFGKLPAGMVQLQAFGPSAAALIPGPLELYAAYTGDDARIYYSSRPAPGSAWQASQGAPPASVLGTPVGVLDEAGDLLLAYVRKADGKLALIKLLTPQNAWTKEALVHDTAITGSDLAFIRRGPGRYAIAWRGFDNDGIYLATGSAHDLWDPPQTIELPTDPTTAPVLVHGLYGADIDVLYGAGGQLRHARITDGQPIAPVSVAGLTGLTAIAATTVQRTPG